MKQQSKSNVLHVILWIAQVLLAAMFLMVGFSKVSQPIPVLASQTPIAGDLPEVLTRCIGIIEILGALGLILPSMLRVKPFLTPLAALGIAIIMLLAAITHLSRGEAEVIPMNFILGLVALFIAWGRYKGSPINAYRYQNN